MTEGKIDMDAREAAQETAKVAERFKENPSLDRFESIVKSVEREHEIRCLDEDDNDYVEPVAQALMDAVNALSWSDRKWDAVLWLTANDSVVLIGLPNAQFQTPLLASKLHVWADTLHDGEVIADFRHESASFERSVKFWVMQPEND